MMRIHATRYLVQNLKSSSFQDAIRHCLSREQRVLFSTSINLSRKESSSIRSNPKIDELFPNVVDFPNRHIGPRKHETQAMCNEVGFNVSHCFYFRTVLDILVYMFYVALLFMHCRTARRYKNAILFIITLELG